MTSALLRLSGITKSYPGVRANDDVSFEIAPGEIHALLGENGAGKSTLVKAIYGLVKPDAGQMTLNGERYVPAEPRAARAAGVAMVFQHFSLFEALSVAENVSLGMEDPPPRRRLAARIREVSQAYGLPLEPDRLVGDLSVGGRQRVEIIRCLLQNPRLLIMDEPTSVLTPQEVDTLFTTLRKLSAECTAILYISHKLEEIRALCDAATILRHGKVVGECVPAARSAREMAEMMVGTDLTPPERSETRPGAVMLEARALTLPAATQFATPLREVSFAVRTGEILGIGGVAGNGQDELMAVLTGETRAPAGTLLLGGEDIALAGPSDRRAMGLRTAPEERLGHAAAPDMSLTENMLLTSGAAEGLLSRGFVRWAAAREAAEKVIETFDVRTPGPAVAARALSGGNLQKFVVGREVVQSPPVFVVNQPTWGVDAAAAATIRQALMTLAATGSAVVVVSQDLDELLEIATWFAAMNEGTLSVPRRVATLSLEEIGLMLGGGERPGNGPEAPPDATPPRTQAAEAARAQA
ncbi:MAG: ABC transporter ATP-binding protein [Rhodobacteraceae bacterium]|nr:ABC transporter ATP-binding protein [Paracoccaceae bacterium]